jgi:hypothetical protein
MKAFAALARKIDSLSGFGDSFLRGGSSKTRIGNATARQRGGAQGRRAIFFSATLF